MTSVLLSPQEVNDLKRLCNNPFFELGSTLRPDHLKCMESRITTRHMAVVIMFRDHNAAKRWNLMHETRIRKGGHIGTIALTTLVYLLGGGAVGSIVTGSTTAIAKDEFQARIWYPKMFKNWTLIRSFTFNYAQFPHQNFYMDWTDVVEDETGKERERRKHGQNHIKVGGPFGIPEKVVRDLITRFPQHKTLIFH